MIIFTLIIFILIIIFIIFTRIIMRESLFNNLKHKNGNYYK